MRKKYALICLLFTGLVYGQTISLDKKNVPCSQLDLIFVLDHSGSVALDDREFMTSLVLSVTEKYSLSKESLRIGFVAFNNELVGSLYPTEDPHLIADFIRQGFPMGGTQIGKGLEKAANFLREAIAERKGTEVQRAVVIISDGATNDDTNVNIDFRDVSEEEYKDGSLNQRVEKNLEDNKDNYRNYDLHISERIKELPNTRIFGISPEEHESDGTNYFHLRKLVSEDLEGQKLFYERSIQSVQKFIEDLNTCL